MAKTSERFEKIYSQGTMNVMEIWVDKETGVNYAVSYTHLTLPTNREV